VSVTTVDAAPAVDEVLVALKLTARASRKLNAARRGLALRIPGAKSSW
jgi:hypothetical protein